MVKAKHEEGWFMLDLGIALSLILFAVLPLAYSFSYEQKAARGYYFRAIATEIVDGEFERLAAGDWKRYSEGQHIYKVEMNAATNLPPGQFLLTIRGTTLRLEWRPEKRGKGGAVVREGEL